MVDSMTPDRADQFEKCPFCRAEFPAAAVICVHCGLDRRTGKRHRRETIAEREADEIGAAPDPMAGWEQAGLLTKVRAVLLVFLVGVPGAGFFAVVCVKAAWFDAKASANERVGFGVAAACCFFMLVFIALAGLRMVMGPRPWIGRWLNRLKWVAAGMVLGVVALLAWALAKQGR